MVEYKLHTQQINDADTKTYGISVYKNNKLVRVIADISTDKNAVEKLIHQFNTYELALCHFDCAIEDFLYDFETY